MAGFFEKSCVETVDAIHQQAILLDQAQVFMVGGFAASPYLFEEVKGRLANVTAGVYRDDGQTAKAVAYGAVACWLDRSIAARVAKETYGIGNLGRTYDPEDPVHQSRAEKIYLHRATGKRELPDAWQCLVQKGDLVSIGATYRAEILPHSVRREAIMRTLVIERYTGGMRGLVFRDMDTSDKFHEVCKLKIEIPPSALQPEEGEKGICWAALCTVVLTLGTTELQCFVEWEDEGKIQRSQATSVWEDF